jgi:hypothetical protein
LFGEGWEEGRKEEEKRIRPASYECLIINQLGYIIRETKVKNGGPDQAEIKKFGEKI